MEAGIEALEAVGVIKTVTISSNCCDFPLKVKKCIRLVKKFPDAQKNYRKAHNIILVFLTFKSKS
jgi:hypothetical protein